MHKLLRYKLLSILFISILLTVLLVPSLGTIGEWGIQTAHAQSLSDGEQYDTTTGSVIQNPAAANPTGTGATPPPADSDWMDDAIKFMGNLLLQAAGMITWLGGQLLNLSIEFTIKNIGEIITSGGIGVQINELWTVIRDVANLVFIFGFVYIGIMTILSPGSTKTKSFLAQLIISALLVNFSLFFVKIVVDLTNVLALEIYNLMGGGDPTGEIMRQMGVSTFYKQSDPSQLAEASGKISFYIAGAAFLIVAGIVFAVGAFMLITRFIAIILLMIFSPIMIAGFVFPGTKKTAKELWARLFGYSLYPAIFLFLLYLSIKILGTSSLDTSGASLAEALSRGDTGDGDIAIILRFAIAIGFLIASMQVAKHFSGYMGNRAASLEGWARGTINGVIGRNTVGRAGAWVADKQDDMRKSDNKFKQSLALGMRTTGISSIAQAGADAKFGSSTSRAAEAKTEKEVNRARSRNAQITKLSDVISTAIKNPADPTAQVAMRQAVAGASHEQLLEVIKGAKPESAEYQAVVANLSTSQYEKIMSEKDENLDDGKKEKIKAARTAHIKTKPVTAMSISDLETLGANYVIANAGSLSASQMDDIKKSKSLQSEFGTISGARETDLLRRFNQNPSQVFDPAKLKDKDAARLPKTLLFHKNAVPHLTGNILRQILDGDTLTPAERNTIRTNMAAQGAQPHPTATQFLNTPQGQNF